MGSAVVVNYQLCESPDLGRKVRWPIGLGAGYVFVGGLENPLQPPASPLVGVSLIYRSSDPSQGEGEVGGKRQAPLFQTPAIEEETPNRR